MAERTDFFLRIITILSWLLIALGVFKMVIYFIGEYSPGIYSKIKTDTYRKLLTGKGNRLLFGLGGAITALLGAAFLAFAMLIHWLSTLSNGL